MLRGVRIALRQNFIMGVVGIPTCYDSS